MAVRCQRAVRAHPAGHAIRPAKLGRADDAIAIALFAIAMAIFAFAAFFEEAYGRRPANKLRNGENKMRYKLNGAVALGAIFAQMMTFYSVLYA